ncbi:MAG: NAD-binding protein [Campylobacterota bacterium]|nr:NAD-binding protein [Campylobacterota bacterium]
MDKMSNKIIIYSFSQIAAKIAETLRDKGYEIIIVEENDKLTKEAIELGYEVKQLSLMDDDNIIEVGLASDDIKAFFCMGDDKNTNLFITLSVRNLNKDIKIISISSTKEDNKTLILAGANKTINPYEIGALRIFRSLHKPLILDVLDNILFSESDIEVAEITIQKDSVLDGVYLNDLEMIDKENIIILGITDKEISDDFIFFSTGINHKIDAGDTLVILGLSNDIKTFNESLK